MESKNKHTVRKDEWMQPYKEILRTPLFIFFVLMRLGYAICLSARQTWN